MLIFKISTLKAEFETIDRRLKTIVYALAGFISHEIKKDLIITSVIRKDNKNSVHYYGRGIDFRINPQWDEPVYTEDELRRIREFCSFIEYSKQRTELNTLRMHDSGSGFHGHLQVNSALNTRLMLEYVGGSV